MNQGTIVQCIGAVVDVEFARTEMPKIYDALKMDEIGLTLEVQQQLGDGIVRTIALGSSDGLRRGMTVVNTGNPITVPVGGKTLGRIMDVLGRPIDERGPVDAEKLMSIHRNAPTFEELSPSQELLETGIKVIDLCCPFAKGGKVGLFGGAGVGKTVTMMELINNIATAHCGPVGVRRRGRAHARGQRLLSRDDRRRRRQQGRPRQVQGGHGVRPDERAARQPAARRADGPHDRRELPRRWPRRAAVHRQHLPLHARRHRVLGAARPDAVRGGLPADAGRGNGPAAGADHVDEDRLHHVDPGRLRARGRPDRPVAGDDLRPPRRDRRAVARHRLARHLSVGRPARLDLAPDRPARDRRGALQHDARRASRCCRSTRNCATSSRFSAWTSCRPRTSSPWRARGRSSASCRSRSAWPKCSPARRASTCR